MTSITLKVLLVAMLMCQAFAAFVSRGARGGSMAGIATTRLNERINTKIDLDSPKVATLVELEPAKKGVYCRCWKSEKFPLCDGAHVKHNEATGDNVGPLIVTAKKPE